MCFSACNYFVVRTCRNRLELRLSVFYCKVSFINRPFFPARKSPLVQKSLPCKRRICRAVTLFWYKTDVVRIIRNLIINKPGLSKRIFWITRIFRNGAVKPFGNNRLPVVHNFFLRLFRKRKHHNAGSIAVKPVDYKRSVIF